MHFSQQRGLELRATHPRVYLLVEALVEWFKQSGAVNFCEMTMHHEELGNFDIIMQRHDGKTPAALVVELKSEIERLKDNWISVRDRLPESVGRSVEYLVCLANGDRMVAAWMNVGGWDFDPESPITHWMPIPEKGE